MRMIGTTYIKVRGIVSLAHRKSPNAPVHGHSYEIWASFHSGDADRLVKNLKNLLAEIDHTEVSPDLANGERLAAWVGQRVGAYSVTVVRPVEGIESGWHRD